MIEPICNKPQLQQEAERARGAATELLQERGRLEAEALKTVLRNQRQRIRDTVRQRGQEIARLDPRQRRLDTIDTELSSEPKRIEASYKVVTHRLEPAGLVYLWPISG